MKSNAPNLEGVVPLYISHFFDIPLEGICKYNGETLFFVFTRDPLLIDGPLEYAVFRLPTEQTEFFMQRKADFERLVGTYWSFSEDQPFRQIGGWSGRADSRSFYDLPKTFDLADEVKRETAELVGYFIWPSGTT